MDWVRRLWFALAVAALLGAVAILLGILSGSAGLSVDSLSATGQPPANGTASCDGVIVRSVSVSVDVARAAVGVENPQWWPVGLSVRASAFGDAKQRRMTLPPGTTETVTIPFTKVLERDRATQERISVVVQVVKGNEAIVRETTNATLDPVEPAQNC